jgi:uncharacterized membrane protein
LRTSRIEALSDGIFAVAMTILVLGIAVPTAEKVPAAELPQALRRLAPEVLAYVISFVNLGVLYVGQHNQYHFIRRADRWFIWINIAYLLLISFIPLSTALLGHYPLQRIALAVYGVNVIAATLMLAVHWQYATNHGHLVDRTLDPRIARLAYRRIASSTIAYAAALLLALIWPVVALTVYLIVPFVNILPYSIDKHFRAAEPRAID